MTEPADPMPPEEALELSVPSAMLSHDYRSDGVAFSQEEEDETIQIHREAEQNYEYFLRHRKKLFSQHRGKWALIYYGGDGKSHMKIREQLPPLLNDKDNRPSSLIEWLDVEISA